MKKNIFNKTVSKVVFSAFLGVVGVGGLTSCSDFWEPESDDMINGEDYIANNTEMYTGFLGIMTKVQQVGDKEILLTEPRGELIEPTATSTPELIALYNYDSNLQGNSYADPSSWYEVIIACNDYLAKMKEYIKQPGVDEEKYNDLVASAVRVKIWAYKTLGEIYGKAYWFDVPIIKVSDIKNQENFQLLTMEGIADKCIELCRNGYEGIMLDRDLDWATWLDKDQSLANSAYRKWNTMVPAYAGLYAELCLWKGAYLDAKSQDAKEYYQSTTDVLLAALTKRWEEQVGAGGTSSSFAYWLPTAHIAGSYGSIWENDQPYPNENVSAIIYDYSKNQTNRLLYHFSNEYPNKYLLAPSEVGEARFTDASFNPGGGSDKRVGTAFGNSSAGGRYLAKFRKEGSSKRANPYQDDVHIYTYRGTQYHNLLIEALNQLGRYQAMAAVMNDGVTTAYFNEETNEPIAGFEGFTVHWTGKVWTKYPSTGMRVAYGVSLRTLQTTPGAASEEQLKAKKHNDIENLHECAIEYCGEGKVYPYMNRLAVRYNDPSIVADMVCPKYQDTGKAGDIRAKIEAGGYWVNYDITLDN